MNPARILILFLTMSTLTRERVESPQYTVVRSESDFDVDITENQLFDVRYYRESAWMTALIDDISFEKSTKNGFHRLFQYTEGANLNFYWLPITYLSFVILEHI